MNDKALRDILTFLELGRWAARKKIKDINESGEVIGLEYWTGAAETLEETTDMINQIVKENKSE